MSLITRIAALATRVAEEFNTVRVELTGKPSMVLWDADTDTWGTRPVSEPIVIFSSTDDVTATPPDDVNLQTGDIWFRHKDAT